MDQTLFLKCFDETRRTISIFFFPSKDSIFALNKFFS
jgi:hypothetical protein